MDGGQYRAPQPADRRVANRAEPAPRQPEEPQPVKEEPRVSYQAEPPTPRAPKEHKRRNRKLIGPIAALVVLIALAIFGWSTWSNNAQNAATAIDSSKYQAVFFTNGQVYFGKLKAFNDDYLRMTDIYYLQTQSSTDAQNLQETSTDQNNVQLIKLGSEIHGPEDEMIISKDQVLFYENLKTDGKVAQSIANYKKSSN